MSDLLKEIDEAVRRDRAAKFWEENGSTILGGAVALVVFTGIFTAWNAWKLKHNTKQTDLLIAALSSPYPATALEAASGSLKGSHNAVAQIHLASALIGDKKNDDALSVLENLSKNSTAPAIWRDLATLMMVQVSFEDTTDAEVEKSLYASLGPILNSDNPWQMQAQLQAALIAAEGLGDYKMAMTHLAVILQDKNVPQSLQDRARALDHLYGLNVSPAKLDKKDPSATIEPKG